MFCHANKKNKMLLKSQLGEGYLKDPENKKRVIIQNIKDDIILVQYKLVDRQSG